MQERSELQVRRREAAIISKFVAVYCHRLHGHEEAPCTDCAGLLDYALERLERCPYDPKPVCRRCPTHCYEPQMRARMRDVMRFSGRHFVRRGRLDWLLRYFFLTRQLNKSELNVRRVVREFQPYRNIKSESERKENELHRSL